MIAAAQAALAQQKYVSVIDVLTGIGWLQPVQVERWRQGRTGSLESLAAVDGAKLREAADLLGEWARADGLTPSDTAYISGTRDRAPLRFLDHGDEAAFRIHWLSPNLTPARREQLVQRQNKAPDLVVVEAVSEWSCAECDRGGGAGVCTGTATGAYLIMSDAGPLCLTCADLDHLEFLPAGDAALSRRAKKESTLAAIVVRFNARRKRYERKGILVEEQALARAEEQCLADEDARLRRRERDAVRRADQDVEFQARMAAEIRKLFPHCPTERASLIADHAALRGSGRVGRSAAAKVLDPEAVTLAVVASVRHLDTEYDRLLMEGVPRRDARTKIRPTLDRVLDSWRG